MSITQTSTIIDGVSITYSLVIPPQVDNFVVYRGKIYRVVSRNFDNFIYSVKLEDSDKNQITVHNSEIRNIFTIIKPF